MSVLSTHIYVCAPYVLGAKEARRELDSLELELLILHEYMCSISMFGVHRGHALEPELGKSVGHYVNARNQNLGPL